MKISTLRERITIQKAVEYKDDLEGISINWEDFYLCYAGIENQSPSIQNIPGATYDGTKIEFLIRYTRKLKNINLKDYQIKFRKNIYEIEGINFDGYSNKHIKLYCKKSSYN